MSDQAQSPTSVLERRSVRAAIVVAVLAALFSPVVTDHDDFPLSTYPIYSGARSGTVTFVTVWGLTDDGAQIEVGMDVIGRSDDPLVVAGELRAAIRAGTAGARCIEIARRVADAEVVAVEIVTETHRTVSYLQGEESLTDRTVYAVCRVPPEAT